MMANQKSEQHSKAGIQFYFLAIVVSLYLLSKSSISFIQSYQIKQLYSNEQTR